MSKGYGEWLRIQRQARDWSVQQMGQKLREAASQAGDELPHKDTLTVMIHRWENNRSGIGERYRIRYCNAFGVPLDRFGGPTLPGVMPTESASHPANCAQWYFSLGYVSAILIGQSAVPTRSQTMTGNEC